MSYDNVQSGRQADPEKKVLSALSNNEMRAQKWTQLDTAVKKVRLHLVHNPHAQEFSALSLFAYETGKI
jgi:hypothetical protein